MVDPAARPDDTARVDHARGQRSIERRTVDDGDLLSGIFELGDVTAGRDHVARRRPVEHDVFGDLVQTVRLARDEAGAVCRDPNILVLLEDNDL